MAVNFSGCRRCLGLAVVRVPRGLTWLGLFALNVSIPNVCGELFRYVLGCILPTVRTLGI